MDDSLYDRNAVQPMVQELEAVGVRSLHTPEDVDATLGSGSGTALVVVNSVCGCAAGNARPGVALSLQHATIPDQLSTVFAGVDRAATDRARSFMAGVAPSSPCIALFKDGSLVHMMERRHIEGSTAEQVAASLKSAYDRFCERKGPSISAEEFEKLEYARTCGRSVPPSSPMMPE